DLLRFERLIADSRRAEPERAAETLREALELWRGPALAEFAPDPFAQVEGGRLEDLRLAAIEQRIDADLALGRHVGLIGELDVLTAEHPHRERLSEQLMLALYRSGRQADALAAYRRVRETLDEIGLEPASALQQLERRILNHDKELDAPRQRESATPEAEGVAPPAVRPTLIERKRVAVLFAAVATTNEAEEDPARTAAFFEHLHAEASAAIEAAGGTVEKGLVGALLAMFEETGSDDDDHVGRAVDAAQAVHER